MRLSPTVGDTATALSNWQSTMFVAACNSGEFKDRIGSLGAFLSATFGAAESKVVVEPFEEYRARKFMLEMRRKRFLQFRTASPQELVGTHLTRRTGIGEDGISSTI